MANYFKNGRNIKTQEKWRIIKEKNMNSNEYVGGFAYDGIYYKL